jgi:hypothetical protein
VNNQSFEAGQDVQVNRRRAQVVSASPFHLVIRWYAVTSWGLVLTSVRSMVARSEAAAYTPAFAAVQTA